VPTPAEFVAKWQGSTRAERAAAQEHFIDLCRMLGQPTPNDADPTGEWYAFEKGAGKAEGGDGFADVWMRDHFAWEYKGKRKDLAAAYSQLNGYREALGNPPLLVVCDLARFEIHTNFTNTVPRASEPARPSTASPPAFRAKTKAGHKESRTVSRVALQWRVRRAYIIGASATSSEAGGLPFRGRALRPAEPDEAAITARARRAPPAMRQGEPDEGRLEIPRVDAGQRGERLEPGETPCVSLRLTQAEVLGRPAGPLVAGRTGACPDAAQLTQEEPNRGRAPTGQPIEGGLDLGRVVGRFGHGGDPAVVTLDHGPRQRQQPAGGAEVVAHVAALVEQGDELVPGRAGGLGDRPDAGPLDRAIRAHGDLGGDPVPEQRGRQEPPLDLVGPLVDRDPELRGVAAAERLDEPPSGPGGRSPFRWLP